MAGVYHNTSPLIPLLKKSGLRSQERDITLVCYNTFDESKSYYDDDFRIGGVSSWTTPRQARGFLVVRQAHHEQVNYNYYRFWRSICNQPIEGGGFFFGF